MNSMSKELLKIKKSELNKKSQKYNLFSTFLLNSYNSMFNKKEN